MATREIDITTRKQLDIYMNPQRQRLLHEMQLMVHPATCKELAGVMGISASSVTHHMKKLEELGLVELDHTEIVRGINARYWRAVPAQVNLRMADGDDLREEKELVVDYLNQRVFEGLRAYVSSGAAARDEELGRARGELRAGVIYLTEDDARAFRRMVDEFIAAHDAPADGTVPWEVSIGCYPHRSEPA